MFWFRLQNYSQISYVGTCSLEQKNNYLLLSRQERFSKCRHMFTIQYVQPYTICKNTISASFLHNSTSHYLSSPILVGTNLSSTSVHSRLESIRVHMPPYFFQKGWRLRETRGRTNGGESRKMDRGAICFLLRRKIPPVHFVHSSRDEFP